MLCLFGLHLSGVRVRGVGVDSVDRLEVEVESAREWSRCPDCGFCCFRVWDRRAKRVRDLGVSGRRTQRWFGVAAGSNVGTAGSVTLRIMTSSKAVCLAGSPDRLVAGCDGDVDSGGWPSSWGWVASDHGPGPRGGGSGGGASSGPALPCVVGRRNVDSAPASVCDCGRLR